MKYLRFYKMSNPEDFLSSNHLELMDKCTPSQQFNSLIPIAFKQEENGLLKAVNFMVVMETTAEEMDKLKELENKNEKA